MTHPNSTVDRILTTTPRARRWSPSLAGLATAMVMVTGCAGPLTPASADARRDLEAALATDPGFSATGAAAARRLLDSLAP